MPRALGFYFYCCKFNIRHFISHPDISALKRVTFLNNVVQSVDVWPQAYHNSAEFYPAVAGSVDIPLKIFLMQPKAIIRIKTFSGKTCIDSDSFRGYYSATVKRMKVTVGQTHIIAPIDGIFFTTWKIDGSLVPERMCDLSCRERGEVVLALSHALYGPGGCFGSGRFAPVLVLSLNYGVKSEAMQLLTEVVNLIWFVKMTVGVNWFYLNGFIVVKHTVLCQPCMYVLKMQFTLTEPHIRKETHAAQNILQVVGCLEICSLCALLQAPLF